MDLKYLLLDLCFMNLVLFVCLMFRYVRNLLGILKLYVINIKKYCITKQGQQLLSKPKTGGLC